MNFIKDYLISPTHKWWVDNVWEPSWTRFLSMTSGIPAALVVAGQSVSHFANDSTISGYLAQMNVPNWIPSGLALISLLYYVAHGRD
jgi:hypothetical protein